MNSIELNSLLFQREVFVENTFSYIFLNGFWSWKMWVSFSRVIFSLHSVFYPFLPSLVKPNIMRKKKRNKEQPQTPSFVVLFFVSHNILNTWKKSAKIQCCCKLNELFSIFSRSTTQRSKEQAECLEAWAAVQGLGIQIKVEERTVGLSTFPRWVWKT